LAFPGLCYHYKYQVPDFIRLKHMFFSEYSIVLCGVRLFKISKELLIHRKTLPNFPDLLSMIRNYAGKPT